MARLVIALVALWTEKDKKTSSSSAVVVRCRAQERCFFDSTETDRIVDAQGPACAICKYSINRKRRKPSSMLPSCQCRLPLGHGPSSCRWVTVFVDIFDPSQILKSAGGAARPGPCRPSEEVPRIGAIGQPGGRAHSVPANDSDPVREVL